MERIWAAIDGGVITNTFVGDDAFAALLGPEHDEIVEVTDMDPRPSVNWISWPDGYRPPTPYPSWVWDGFEWRAPTPMPSDPGSWRWDEDSMAWVDVAPPEA